MPPVLQVPVFGALSPLSSRTMVLVPPWPSTWIGPSMKSRTCSGLPCAYSPVAVVPSVIVSLPAPPRTVVVTVGLVLSTSNVSLPLPSWTLTNSTVLPSTSVLTPLSKTTVRLP